MRDWLSHRVAATPDEEALVSAASGRAWSYANLDVAADAMAARLAGLGVGPGDHLAVAMPPRTEYVTLVHAAMRVGARLVPLSHRLTAAELRPRLDAADVTLLVCGRATADVAVEATSPGTMDGVPTVPVVSLDEPTVDRVAHLQAVDEAEFDHAPWDRADPLLMLFTSGSTGTPNLVVLTLGNVLSSAVASAFRLGVDPDGRTMAALAFHHTGGIMPLYRAVLYGTSIVLRTEFEAGGVADDLREFDVTAVSLVPTMLRRMLDARGTLADSLEVVLLGGAPATEGLVKRCRHYSVPVHPTYGMTETASGITVARPAETAERPDTVGRPLFWTDLRVVDDEGEELPPGEPGEFVVSAPTVSPGYYGDPEATEAAFVGGELRTGDVGYRDEAGYCYVLNRLDDRIITGGENVDPGEVVAALRDHPGVADAAVVGVPDEEWGERVAALVVRSDPDLDADGVTDFLEGRLAGFKRPRTVAFAEDLPRTDSGTVERPAVVDLLERAAAETEEEPSAKAGGESPDGPDAETGEEPDEEGEDASGGAADVASGEGADAESDETPGATTDEE